MSVKVIGPFFLLLFTPCVFSTLIQATSNTSNVCSSAGVRASCSHQISGDRTRDDGCTVQRVSNLKAPATWTPTVENSSADQLVHLQVYRHQVSGRFNEVGKFTRVGFNLSLTNPSGEPINVCYIDPALPESTVCLEYMVKVANPGQNFTLWYDCIFRDRGFEGTPYLLNFHVGNQKGQFSFRVPKEENLHKNPVFLYTYLTASQKLTATLQLNSLNVTKYHLFLLRWESDSAQIIEEKIASLRNSTSLEKRWNDLVTVSFDLDLPTGNYSVTASCEDSSCSQIFSPFIVIKAEGSESSPLTLLLILGAGIALLGAAIYIYMNYRKDLNRRGDRANSTLVLLYSPVSNFHCEQVEALRLFLQKYLRVDVLLDVVDVPKTDHKDPLKWYSSVITQAEYVAVVPPPAGPASLPGSVSIYQNTFNLALQLLGPRLEKSFSSTFLVILENSSLEKIPDVCCSLRKFKLPKEIGKLEKLFKVSKGNPQSFQTKWKKPSYDLEFENLLLSVQKTDRQKTVLFSEDLECLKNLEVKISDSEDECDESTQSSQGLRFHRDGQQSDEQCSSEDEDDSITFGDVKLIMPTVIA